MKSDGNAASPSPLLRFAARVAVIVGGAGSLAIMFRLGSRNPSLLLMALFTAWVGAPYLALILYDLTAGRRSQRLGSLFYSTMLLLSLGSLAIYARVAAHPPAKPAAPFLLVPLASCLLLAIAAFVSTRKPRK